MVINLDLKKPESCKQCRFQTYMYKSPEPSDGVVRVCILTRCILGCERVNINCPIEGMETQWDERTATK